jgi:hypothetical protein
MLAGNNNGYTFPAKQTVVKSVIYSLLQRNAEPQLSEYFLISKLIQTSFINALERGKDFSNSKRSKLWVECLAQSFRNIDWKSDITVFSRDYNGNRGEFRLNELLFDITVAEVKIIKSVKGSDITTVTGVKWLVESEFKKTDSRDIIIDFSKLMIGDSENKLLVISAGSSLTQWSLETIPNLIRKSSSNFYLAFIPHPDDWYSENCPKIEVCRYRDTDKDWLCV